MKKTIQLLLAVQFVAASLSAQGTAGLAIGGSRGEQFYHVSALGEGGYLLVGSTDSEDADLTDQALGAGDLWVLKTTANGTTEWQRRFGGAGHESGVAAAVSHDGSLYFVVGTIDSLDGDISKAYGQQDIWLLAMKPTGDPAWQRTLGGSQHDHATGVIALADGGCLVYGSTNSSDGDISVLQGSTDIWLVKLDANGQTIWSTTVGGQASDLVNKVIATPEGDFIVAGSTNSNDVSMPAHKGEADALLARLNANGELLWLRTYGGSADDTFADILPTTAGTWYICGQTNSTDGDISAPTSQTDVWLLQTDEAGNLNWAQTYGGKNDDMGLRIHQVSDSSLLITANTFDMEEGMANKTGKKFDGWLLTVKMSKGEVLHSKLLGGSEQDFIYSSALENGKLALAGHTNSNDDDVSGAKGGVDGLFFLFLEDEFLSERGYEEEKVTAWPNPAQTSLQFSRPITGHLWSDTGILMQHFTESTRIDIHSLPAGIYLIKVSSSAQVIRIVKMLPDSDGR